ncbi:unnamed protein product [Leptidea sinapis]|uniref:Uncharacterized protein n=1 Tax=Leptidea sinapis TaxID=189913 RepID=A0A5E4Q2V3_9NEOP|nr:unnamed protein product [Leptidea sinapis]
MPRKRPRKDLESKLGTEFQNKLQRARSLSERDRSGSMKRKTPDGATPNDVGVMAAVITIVMNLVLQVFQVGSNYWLAMWSNDASMQKGSVSWCVRWPRNWTGGGGVGVVADAVPGRAGGGSRAALSAAEQRAARS